MNERIVKLFMQSVDSNYIPLPIEDHIPSWAEKFAELIVRECAEYAEHELDMAGYKKKFMLKHFGVEE
jgi:hypothetical protein